MATIAVRDLKTAKAFYEGKLGLELTDSQEEGTVSYKCGNSTLLVYESQFAGTNKATAATWIAGDDVEGVVKALKAKGVGFEHYDMPDTRREGDIHIAGNMKVAWFKDPDGNIHAIVTG
jgi:catechol 2,3-dioxygenase-like lactoylglutathione lyase family enzyme